MAPRLQCDLCEQTYAHKKSLYRHRQTRHGNVKYKCSICRHVFTRRDTITKHLRRHLDQTTRQSSSTQKLSEQKKQPVPLQDSHATETTSNTSEHPPTRSHLLKPTQQITAHVNGKNSPGAQRQLAQLQLQEDQEKLFAELDVFLEELEFAASMYVNERDNLPIPTNIRKLAIMKATPTAEMDCINLVNTHKILIYACGKIYRQVDKEEKRTPCHLNIVYS